MSIEAGALVIIHCQNPKEKLWGEILRLDAVGAVLRGLDLDSVEDWLRQEREAEARYIQPSTVFFPTHRLERVYLDESSGLARSFAERFADNCDGDVREALARGTEPDE